METISYNFYEDYTQLNPNFTIKMNQRIDDIKEKYIIKLSNEDVIKDYFVELFSWTIFPYNILQNIYEIIKDKCDILLDPCCGNSFHTYLFETFTPLKCLSFDIQNEKNSWTNITETNGLFVLQQLPNHQNICLFLSCIDNEHIGMTILDSFKGNIIISVGNYEGTSPNYLSKLHENYNIIYCKILQMPWNLTEKIEIYVKK